MKNFWLILLFFALATACSEGKKKTDEVAEASDEVTIKESEPEIEPIPGLPYYDYAELEQEFFTEREKPIYVINFWATWCKPCVKELPAFEMLGKEYKDKNVEVVLVSLDFPEHGKTRVVPFIEEHDLKSRLLLLDDPNANYWISAVDEKWSGAIPATVIVKNGERHFYERSFTYEELENELKTIL